MTAGITGMHPHAQAIWNQEIEIICICSLMFLVDKIALLSPAPSHHHHFPSSSQHQPPPRKRHKANSSALLFATIHHGALHQKEFFFLIQLSAFSELRLN